MPKLTNESKFEKLCSNPDCKIVRTFKIYKCFLSAKDLCNICCLKTKKCIDCPNLIQEKSTRCRTCGGRLNFKEQNRKVSEGEIPNPFKDKIHSKETRQHLSEINKGKNVGELNHSKRLDVREKIRQSKLENNYIRGKTFEEYFGKEKAKELKTNKRELRAKQIMDGKMHPTFYNKNAIAIIEQYGVENGYNFQHAENGGEIPILGYWLDGFDKENNVVIEFYERRRHYDIHGNLRQEDLVREEAIIKKLDCKFIRINAFDKNHLKYEIL